MLQGTARQPHPGAQADFVEELVYVAQLGQLPRPLPCSIWCSHRGTLAAQQLLAIVAPTCSPLLSKASNGRIAKTSAIRSLASRPRSTRWTMRPVPPEGSQPKAGATMPRVVFAYGTADRARTVYRSFTRVTGSTGLRVIRLHDARHGCAILLTAGGVAPRVVMEILGHSQIAVTMNVYAHVVLDTQREAVSHMERLLTRRLHRE